jgi:hypothetical protein
MDGCVRPAELGEALAATAAGAAQALPPGHHRHLGDSRLAGRHHGPDRRRLGALALRKGGVLDVAADEDAAAARPDSGTHREPRVRRMGVEAHGTRRLEQLVTAHGAARSGQKSGSRIWSTV